MVRVMDNTKSIAKVDVSRRLRSVWADTMASGQDNIALVTSVHLRKWTVYLEILCAYVVGTNAMIPSLWRLQ